MSGQSPENLIVNVHVKLPHEILETIFYYTVHNHPLTLPQGLAQDPRMYLLRVCSYWRTAALGTPTLWNDVIINLDSRLLQVVNIADEILKRSLGAPCVCITARVNHFHRLAPLDLSADEFVNRLILPYAPSLKKLSLCVHFPFIKRLLSQPQTITFPNLRSLLFRQASPGTLMNGIQQLAFRNLWMPRLEAVELDLNMAHSSKLDQVPLQFVQSARITTLVTCPTISTKSCYDLLSSFPELESCGIHLWDIDEVVLATLPKLEMLHLKRLHIRFSSSSTSGYIAFLSLFILPAIRDLALKRSRYGLDWHPFLSEFIMERCGPFIENLYIANSPDRVWGFWGFSDAVFQSFIDKYSRTLRRLFIHCLPLCLPYDFVRKAVSREKCPELESLFINEHCLQEWGQWNGRVEAILDGIKDAEDAGRQPLRELYFYDAPLVLRECSPTRLLDTVPNQVRVHVLWETRTLSEIERKWFGYCA
ncbi:hypothetical protein AX17_004702 [Amanita inopinata Kibby_2008]|nr:hypothetical protein AX17_004702 [Amanita inopinata Kibby_2008]